MESLSCKHQVILDVPTRWNSTYLMLDKAEKYQKAFERMEEDDYQYATECGLMEGYEGDTNTNHKGKKAIQGPLLNYDWEKARVFVRFLKFFCDATLKFSATMLHLMLLSWN